MAIHNSKEDCWFVYKNAVYDVTKFISLHPAGPSSIIDYAGLDSTLAFDQVGHSISAQNWLFKYKIGNIAK